MSSRRRKQREHGHDRYQGRGRHRKASSPETRAWEAEHLLPEPPPWMSPDTYRALAQLRGEL